MNVVNGHLSHRGHRDVLQKKSLHVRNPGLIDLPLSLPSLPIPALNSLVTDLIGDSRTTSTSTTAAPPPVTTTSSSGGNGGSNSGGGGGSSQGGGSGSSTTSSGSNSGGTSGSGSNGSGGNPSGSATTSASSSSPTGSDSGNPGDHPGGSGNNNGSSPTDGHGQTLAVNPGSNPPSSTSFTTKVSTIFSNGTPVATQTNIAPVPSNTSGPSGTTDGPSNGPSGNPSGDTGTKGVSSGVIAGCVIVALLLLLALVIFCLRKRAKAKRTERKLRWWQARRPATQSDWSGAETGDATAGSGPMSARSSFATTFDHGQSSGMVLDFSNASLPVPPMAEIRDAHGPGLLLHSQDSAIPVAVPEAEGERRVSTYSNRSSSSEGYAINPFLGTLEPGTPMSVRPFSPSELFYFPKPPGRVSTDISKTVVNSPVDNVPPTPALSPALSPETILPSNPFADPQTPDVKVIRRPFEPTLHDEISVYPGDHVRISKVFDDGWALIEKYPLEDDNEKGKRKQIQGLIPLNCLREADEELPAFLASKRVSSYAHRSVGLAV